MRISLAQRRRAGLRRRSGWDLSPKHRTEALGARVGDPPVAVRLRASSPATSTREPPRSRAARDLPLLPRALAVPGESASRWRPRSRRHLLRRRAARRAPHPTLSESWPEIQPARRTAARLATTSSATRDLGRGSRRRRRSICGTTRETTPNATSVISSAASTGAAISSAAVKIVEQRRARRRASERRPRRGRAGRAARARRGVPRPRSVRGVALPPLRPGRPAFLISV